MSNTVKSGDKGRGAAARKKPRATDALNEMDAIARAAGLPTYTTLWESLSHAHEFAMENSTEKCEECDAASRMLNLLGRKT